MHNALCSNTHISMSCADLSLHACTLCCCCCGGGRFVNFVDPAAAAHAQQCLHGNRLPSGHKLHVTLQTPRLVRPVMLNQPGALVQVSTPATSATNHVVVSTGQMPGSSPQWLLPMPTYL